jgi:hypothetical protein
MLIMTAVQSSPPPRAPRDRRGSLPIESEIKRVAYNRKSDYQQDAQFVVPEVTPPDARLLPVPGFVRNSTASQELKSLLRIIQ